MPAPLDALLARKIARLARTNGLVLFLGAGVNGDAGLMWKELLEELLTRGIQSAVAPAQDADASRWLGHEVATDSAYDSYARAGIGALLLGPHQFLPTLRSLIYSRCDLSGLDAMCRDAARNPGTAVDALGAKASAGAFGLLAALARLCMRPEIIAVVTYNFDMLLELAMKDLLAERGTPVRPDRSWINRHPFPIARQFDRPPEAVPHPQLAVYHVHGCLPPTGDPTHLTCAPVVLSQQDYTRTMQDPYAWEESSQLHFLRSYPCLFVGLSMTDWNILRLLQSAKTGRETDGRLYAVGSTTTGLRGEIRSRLLAEYGVSFHGAEGPEAYSGVRGFVDQLFSALHCENL